TRSIGTIPTAPATLRWPRVLPSRRHAPSSSRLTRTDDQIQSRELPGLRAAEIQLQPLVWLRRGRHLPVSRALAPGACAVAPLVGADPRRAFIGARGDQAGIAAKAE